MKWFPLIVPFVLMLSGCGNRIYCNLRASSMGIKNYEYVCATSEGANKIAKVYSRYEKRKADKASKELDILLADGFSVESSESCPEVKCPRYSTMEDTYEGLLERCANDLEIAEARLKEKGCPPVEDPAEDKKWNR